MHNYTEFHKAIAASGLIPPDEIIPGKIIRFPGLNKPPKNKDAWCFMFPDELGGVFGDYSSGMNSTWQAVRKQNYSAAERQAFEEKVRAARNEREQQKAIDQSRAAMQANKRWDFAKVCDTSTYLQNKGVKSYGLRHEQDGGIIVPIYNLNNEIVSLQTIDSSGQKRFLEDGAIKGNFFLIGQIENRVIICEGYATGASIHEATGICVAVAFNSGNLNAVAKGIKSRYPKVNLIIAADDDHSKESNVGLAKANEAAISVGCLIALPLFADERQDKWTDFNDLHTQEGLDAIRYCFDDSQLINPANVWPTPLEISPDLQAEPYPINALPTVLREAVQEVQDFVKSPMALVACSGLATISIACQGLIDVERAKGLKGPTSLFMLGIAASGERKTTADTQVSQVIREYDLQQAELMKPDLDAYKADMASWAAKRDAIIANIKQVKKKAKPTDLLESDLVALQKDEPERPRVPHLLLGDATPEGLAISLAQGWPSAGVMSSEAGLILGAHGMSAESIMRNLGLLNILWDGQTHQITRRTAETIILQGARLTMSLQLQEEAFREFQSKSGGLARGIGFLARFLVAFPDSTQGTRFFTESPPDWPKLNRFHKRVYEILHMVPEMTEDYALTPKLMRLSVDSKKLWIKFHDAIESGLIAGGELEGVRDVASKAADNAARLAALFQMVEYGMGEVSADSFESASAIVAWHLHEARRFLTQMSLKSETKNLIKVDEWLLRQCRNTGVTSIAKNHLRQTGPIRESAALDRLLKELVNLNRLRIINGRPVVIEINPLLLAKDE
jgi:putative DNA primase/helicase